MKFEDMPETAKEIIVSSLKDAFKTDPDITALNKLQEDNATLRYYDMQFKGAIPKFWITSPDGITRAKVKFLLDESELLKPDQTFSEQAKRLKTVMFTYSLLPKYYDALISKPGLLGDFRCHVAGGGHADVSVEPIAVSFEEHVGKMVLNLILSGKAIINEGWETERILNIAAYLASEFEYFGTDGKAFAFNDIKITNFLTIGIREDMGAASSYTAPKSVASVEGFDKNLFRDWLNNNIKIAIDEFIS